MQHIDTIDALSTVIRHELPDELQRCRLDLERARMKAEDLRGAMFSPGGQQLGESDPRRHRYPSFIWRELFQDRDASLTHAYNIIVPTQELLEQGRQYIRTHGIDSTGTEPHVEPRVVLTMAYNIMCECERTLNGEADETEDDDTED